MTPAPPARHAPVRVALAIVVGLTAFGISLRLWGPINPAIAVTTKIPQNSQTGIGQSTSFSSHGSGSTLTKVGSDGKVRVWLTLSNHSRSSVQIAGARIQPANLADRAGVRVTHVSGIAKIRAGDEATIGLVVDFDTACGLAPGSTHRFTPVADLRTTSGRIKVVGGNVLVLAECPAD